MSDVKRLLDEATPRPWTTDQVGNIATESAVIGEAFGGRADARLIVYAVNRLPDLEALREVTEQLVVAADPYRRQYLAEKAEDILRRLREPERVAS